MWMKSSLKFYEIIGHLGLRNHYLEWYLIPLQVVKRAFSILLFLRDIFAREAKLSSLRTTFRCASLRFVMSDEYRVRKNWSRSVISVGIVFSRGTRIPLEVVFYIASADAHSQLHVAPRQRSGDSNPCRIWWGIQWWHLELHQLGSWGCLGRLKSKIPLEVTWSGVFRCAQGNR